MDFEKKKLSNALKGIKKKRKDKMRSISKDEDLGDIVDIKNKTLIRKLHKSDKFNKLSDDEKEKAFDDSILEREASKPLSLGEKLDLRKKRRIKRIRAKKFRHLRHRKRNLKKELEEDMKKKPNRNEMI